VVRREPAWFSPPISAAWGKAVRVDAPAHAAHLVG